jgi:hypothetical protein
MLYILRDAGDRAAAFAQGQAWPADFIREVLGHLRLPYQVLNRADLAGALHGRALLLIPYDAPLAAAERRVVEDFVASGGARPGGRGPAARIGHRPAAAA